MNNNLNYFDKIKKDLKWFLKNQTLRKHGNLEYNNPNYWEVAWLKYFFKTNKISRPLQEKLVKELGFLPPYDFI